MPYIRADVDSYDEIASELGDEVDIGERPSGDFEYSSTEAKFDWKKLSPAAAVIRQALLAAGAKRFRVCYDGGYDEGFAHSDQIQLVDRQLSAQEAAKKLASPSLLEQVQKAVATGSRWAHSAEYYKDVSAEQAFKSALDELAHELASRLLGDGYGTGEYQLYGAFTADLETGDIVDHEDAAKPSEME